RFLRIGLRGGKGTMGEEQKGLARGDRPEAVGARHRGAWRDVALRHLSIGISAVRLQSAHQKRLEGDKTDGHALCLTKWRIIAMAIAGAGDGGDPKAAHALAKWWPPPRPRAETSKQRKERTCAQLRCRAVGCACELR